MTEVPRGCPHRDIRYCPLYRALHGLWNETDDTRARQGGYGCDDGRLNESGCAVDHGLNYREAVERLRVVAPRLVAECEFGQAAEELAAQRRNNMKLAGLH